MSGGPRPAGLLLVALSAAVLGLAMAAGATAQGGASADPVACPSLMEQARAADLQIATAQAQRIAPAQLAALQTASLDVWVQAVARCDGRDRERAERGLAEARRTVQPIAAAREAPGEPANALAECDRIARDAQALQNLGAVALADRRWPDAASLYRKARDTWDLASEKCPPVQREAARQRRDQTSSDAHNAEFCAPGFDSARELTMQLRAGDTAAFGGSIERLSQTAETAWREAIPRCTGAIQSIARDNAQMVRQLRGTQWVPALPESARLAPLAAGPAAPQPVLATPLAVAPAGPIAAVPPVAVPPVAVPPVAVPPVAVPPVAVPPVALASQISPAVVPAAPARPASAPALPASALVPLPAAPAPTQPSVASAGAARPSAPLSAQPPAAPAVPARPTAVTAALQPTVTAESVMLVGSNRYVGAFKSDPGGKTLSGSGRIEWANGDVFEGTVIDGKRSGKGVFTWVSGQKYDGDWVNDAPAGKGAMRFASGDVFTGELVAGEPNGIGRMAYASGDVYAGPFVAGIPTGLGAYTWRDGQHYEGPFVRGTPQGRGIIRFANGNQYEGDVVNGLPEGAGKMTYAFGDRYEGGHAAGLAHGQGSYVWKNGDRFLGQWVAGKRSGRGVLTWVNGDTWNGEFQNDERTENGQLIRKGS